MNTEPPESSYSYLVRRTHPWRERLFFKGRRLPVGRFLDAMRIEGWSPERAADEYELPIEPAYEAIDYGERFRSLIDAERAADAAAAKRIVRGRSS